MKRMLSIMLAVMICLTLFSTSALAKEISFPAVLADFTLSGLTLQEFNEAGERNELVIPAVLLLDYFFHTSDPVWFEFCNQGSFLRCYEDHAEAFYVNGAGELLCITYAPTTQQATYSIQTDVYTASLGDYTSGLEDDGVVSSVTLEPTVLVALIDDIINYFLK